jgi:hypothetical protein
MTSNRVPADLPRFVTDSDLMRAFGLSKNALAAFRRNPAFPKRDPVLKKTDRKAVDSFFDKRAGLTVHVSPHGQSVHDGEENFAA